MMDGAAQRVCRPPDASAVTLPLGLFDMPISDLLPAQCQILNSGRWFASLPASLQQALRTHARVVALRAGERLFQRGDDNDGLYAVLEGTVCFGAVSQSGKESVVGLAEPPQWFGEVALLDGGRRTHFAWADCDATLAHVPLPAISAWLAEHPPHWEHIAQLAAHKLRVMFAAIEDASLHPSRDRLIRCLASLARGYGERDAHPTRTLHVSQERLGSMLSLSRQTVNALLQGLERDGLVACIRGGVRILDLERLLNLEASIQ
jgi:CRP/FNR family transcriptional regulator, cyclic AMP receptor protein